MVGNSPLDPVRRHSGRMGEAGLAEAVFATASLIFPAAVRDLVCLGGGVKVFFRLRRAAVAVVAVAVVASVGVAVAVAVAAVSVPVEW